MYNITKILLKNGRKNMSNCKFRQVEEINNSMQFVTYTCEDFEVLKKKWREKNMTDQIIESGGRDRSYEAFCDQLDNICQCLIQDKCEKCSDEDHEGFFCRCEPRNIKLAKQRREKGLSVWKKN